MKTSVMRTFRGPDWMTSTNGNYTFREMFQELAKKKNLPTTVLSTNEGMGQRSLQKMLRRELKDFQSSNVITVQTKIELGNMQKKKDHSLGGYETFGNEKKSRKKCKKSKAEMSSDSEDSESDISKKRMRMVKQYRSSIDDLNNDSHRLSKEYLREKKRQRKLKKKLEKAARKQSALNKVVVSKLNAELEGVDLTKVKEEPVDKPTVSKPVIRTTNGTIVKVKIEPGTEGPGPGPSNNPIKPKVRKQPEKKIPVKEPISKVIPLKPKVLPVKPKVVPVKPKVVPVQRKVVPVQPKVVPVKPTVSKEPEKKKPSLDLDIPTSLMIIKQLKMQEKLKNILQEVEQKRAKPILTLKQKMMEKLKAARFRFLNEQIYTTDSKAAQRIFKNDPEAFIAYHEGYRQQVKSWPLNPLHIVIKAIRRMPKNYIIADFGCGDAKLAKCVEQKVHSFDLVAVNDSVVACDMVNVPLPDASVDVAVFCLSLMGTNLRDYLAEANRVLKPGGTLKIAEVESRFENVDGFLEGLLRFGFKKIWKDLSHNLFYFMDFKKVATVNNKKKLPTISLLPCLYKKR